MPPPLRVEVVSLKRSSCKTTFTVTGTTYTDVTGMSKSISFTAGHKILIMFHGHVEWIKQIKCQNIRLCDSNGL